MESTLEGPSRLLWTKEAYQMGGDLAQAQFFSTGKASRHQSILWVLENAVSCTFTPNSYTAVFSKISKTKQFLSACPSFCCSSVDLQSTPKELR